MQQLARNLGFVADDDVPRLVDSLPEDTALHYKMMVDLLQTIADNTYTLINLSMFQTIIGFLSLIAIIVDLLYSIHANTVASKQKAWPFAKGGIVHAANGFTFKNTDNGLVKGPGTETSDSIPAMLSDGEAVLNAKAVKQLGTNFIDNVNNGNFARIRAKIPHFAEGGIAGRAEQMTARGMGSFANSGNGVSVSNNMNIALVRDEQEAMGHFMRSPAGQRILVDFQRGNGRVFSRFNS